MTYRAKFWRTTGAIQEEITQDDRPVCGVDGCPLTPDHLLSWTVNPTGLNPTHVVRGACYMHLHPLLKEGEGRLPLRHVTVTAYKPV